MKRTTIVAALAVATAATPALSCASCGCTLTSDWLSQGLVAQPGTTVSLRYDYVPQTILRSGGQRLHRDAIVLPADREIERRTDNHYVTAMIDRQFDADWGVNVQLPVIVRPHSTIAEGDTAASGSRTHGIGDLRVTARWQGFRGSGAITGVQFGLVLPTGVFDQRFRSGPQTGEAVDRGLQPGQGVVQATIGGYRYGRLAADLDYIVQVQGQAPLDDRDRYRPGISAQASAGVHYTRWRGITPQVQINFRAAARDHGFDSDHANSGGTQLYLAPGLIAALGRRTSVYGYVQLPAYQRVHGDQLTPRYTASLGVQYRI